MTAATSSGFPATERAVMGPLLLRGMLVGLVAGLLAFGFARVFGEPSVDRAIAFEEAEAKLKSEPSSEEIVSRETQASIGLLTGVAVYGTALGGLFALAFAFSCGRFGRVSPRLCAAVLALLGFVAVYGAPFLKYPANPPAVGDPATIGTRTALYFSMIVMSVVAMMAAFSLSRLLHRRFRTWNAVILSALAYLAMMGAAGVLLPSVDEVPEGFPAVTLWQFRLANFGIQAVLWSVIGLLFGVFAERSLTTGGAARRPT